MNLNSISDYCGNTNVGSIKVVEYLSISGVDDTAWEYVINSSYEKIGPVPLASGYSWLQAPLIHQGRKLISQVEKKTQQGSYYQVNVRGMIPGHSPALSRELDKMRSHWFLLRIKDSNGEQFLIGNLDYPFRFSHSHTSGDLKTALNHHQVRWSGIMPHLVPELTF